MAIELDVPDPFDAPSAGIELDVPDPFSEPAAPETPTEDPSYASRVGTAAGLGLQNVAAGAKYGLEQTAATPVAMGAGLLDFATNMGELISPIGIAKSLFAEKPATAGEPQDFLTAVQQGANKIFSAFADAPVTQAIQGAAPGALEFGVPGAQAYADETRAAIQQTNERLAANKAAGGGGFGLDVATGLAQMAPAVGVGLATRSPAAAAATLAAPMFGQTLAEGEGDVAQRAQRAAAFTGAEFVTELPVGKLLTLPASALVREIGKNGVAQVMGRIAKTAGAEGLQEASTNVLQDLYDNGALDENKSIGDIIADAGYAGAVGALAGSVAGAPAAVVEARQSGKATQADAQAREAYKATLKEVDAGDGTTTFVDASGTPVGDTLDEVNASVAALPLETIAQRMQAPPVTPEQEAQRLAPVEQAKPGVSQLPEGYFEPAASTATGELQAPDTNAPALQPPQVNEPRGEAAANAVAQPLEELVAPDTQAPAMLPQAKPSPMLKGKKKAVPAVTEKQIAAAATAPLGDVTTPEDINAPARNSEAGRPGSAGEIPVSGVGGARPEILGGRADQGGVRGERFAKSAVVGEVAPGSPEIRAMADGRQRDDSLTQAAPEFEASDDILQVAREDTNAAEDAAFDVMLKINQDEQGVLVGKPTGLDRAIQKGDLTIERASAPWKRTRDALRKKYGDTITLFRADAPESERSPDTKLLFMGDKNLAEKFAAEGRTAQPFTIPVDDIVAVNAKGDYYEFIVKKPDTTATQQAAATQETQNAQEVRSDAGQVRQGDAAQGRQVKGSGNFQRTAEAGTETRDAQEQVAPEGAAEFAGPTPAATPSEQPSPAPTSKPVPAGAAGLTERLRRTGVDVPDGAYTDARLPGYAGEAVDAMATLFKKRVVVFRAGENAPKKSGGLLFPADPGTIYLNADANVHPAVVFMHELVHSMKRTDPKTYAALEKALLPMLRNREGYVKTRLGGKDLGALTEEEMIADLMADHASDPKFWSDLYGRFDDKSAWQQFSDYIRRLLSNVIDVLYPVGAYRYIDDFNAAYEHVVDAAYNHARAQHGDGAAAGEAMESRALPQTDTPAFKKWFGNSKVVDEQGKPLVVYHGTESRSNFAEFSTEKQGSTDEGWFGKGFYFSPNPDVAEVYGRFVMPVYVSLQNPFIFPDDVNPIAFVKSKGGKEAFSAWVKERGHDGIISNSVLVQTVAFRPNQIKSAIGNRGTFDPESDSVLESRPIPPDTDASRALDALKNEDPSLYGRAKKLWRQGFFPGGLLRGDVAKRNFERQARIAGIGYEAGNAVGELERAVEQGYGKSYNKLTDAEVKNLQAALTGKPVTALPQPVQQAIVAMRQMIDRMSREYMDILRQQIAVKVAAGEDVAKDAKTLATITANLESYVNRSYRAFDDPKWWDNVDAGVVQRAVKYLADGYVAAGMSEKDANTRANQVVASFKTGSAADSVESFIKESKLGAKDLSVLMRRKDVPQEIRSLLGEYFDPRVNFTKSVAKMGRLIQNQQFLSAVRDMGMGSLFWEEGDLQRPAAARFPMAGERADTYSPLNGLLTTKDVAEAFQEAVQPSQPEGWYKWVVKANALVNYGKTVLSPATQMRNFQSAAMFTLANGHFNWGKIADSYNLLSSRYGSADKRKEAQAYVKKLIDMGVLGDNANAGDFQAYLQSSGIDRLFDPDTPIGKWNRGAKALYQFSDDFWKIVGYENELAAQKRAGLSEDAAEMEAAIRIRNTYPTYSMAGRAIKALARSPIAGAFPTFSAEIIRNSYHIVRYAVNDIQQGLATGNKGQLRNGVQRMAGMAMVNAAIVTLGVYTAQSIGLDDEEEEAVRQLLPPWQKNSNIMWTGRDELGRPTFIDMSWMDVYGIWKRPITAALRDQPLDDAFKQGVTEFLSPFLGADIAIQAVWEVVTNKRVGSNAPVYDEATKMEDIANHLRKAAQPGAAGNVERFWKAYKDEVKPGGVGEYSELEEALALVGWRWSKVDPALGLRSKSYDFADATKKAGVSLRKSLSSPNDVDDAELEQQVETAIELNAEAHKRLKGVVDAAMKTGLTKQQARNILENSGIGKKRAADILNDKPVYFALSDRAEKDAMDRAVSIPGRKDNRAEIRRRYALAERMLREKQKGAGG